MRCAISFASSLLRLSVRRGEVRREDTMNQLQLFPPPAPPSVPLLGKARSEATSLLASLLIAVSQANSKKRQRVGKDGHE